MAKGLQHAIQLLLVHRERQVGNVKVCGVLLLLLLQYNTMTRTRTLSSALTLASELGGAIPHEDKRQKCRCKCIDLFSLGYMMFTGQRKTTEQE